MDVFVAKIESLFLGKQKMHTIFKNASRSILEAFHAIMSQNCTLFWKYILAILQ